MTAPYSPPLDLVTTAALELLRGSAAERGPRWLYDGAYDGDPLAPAYPYGILYRVPGGSADPMPDLDLDLRTVTVPYQVTTVSNVRNQCERAAGDFRDLLLARSGGGWAHELALPDGWACVDRRPDPAMPGIDRTGDYPTVIFTLPAKYLLTIAPTD